MRYKLLGQIAESQHQNPRLFWKLMKKLKESKHNDSNPITLHNVPLTPKRDTNFTDSINIKVNEIYGFQEKHDYHS